MKTMDVFEIVNLSEIQPSSENVRGNFNQESVKELAESMRQNGLINPLTLRVVGKNQFEIICGERRFHAAKLLGWETVYAYIKDVTVEEAKRLCLIENIQREDISLVVLATPVYSRTNDTVIERLKLLEYEIKQNTNCYHYPVKREGEQDTYNKQMEELELKERQGGLTRYAVIQENSIAFQYTLHAAKNGDEDLKEQLDTLLEKDKRNKELKVINTVKELKEVCYKKEIPKGKAFSKLEESFVYFFMLDSLRGNHFKLFGLPKNTLYLDDKNKQFICENLTEEWKTIIRRDFLSSKFDRAFGDSVVTGCFMEYMKLHFKADFDVIEKKFDDVYNKRLKRINERKTEIEKELKKKGKTASTKTSKRAAA